MTAVSIGGKLRYRTEEEQQLWSECRRLLANCIIYYNAAILSRVLEERRAAGDLAGVEQLSQVAPIAWQHINFYGRYEFTSGWRPLIWSGSSRRGGSHNLAPPLCALGLGSERRDCRSGSARYGIEVGLPDSSSWPSGASGAGVLARQVKLSTSRCGAALAAPVAAAKTA